MKFLNINIKGQLGQPDQPFIKMLIYIRCLLDPIPKEPDSK